MKFIHSVIFVFLYLWEVVRSTASLTWLVLRPRLDLHPRFVEVPLELREDFPRFLFACLVSMTPGSMSVSLDPGRGVLLVHLLDARDPASSIAQIKSRIESPLLRIFGP
jgi:multicomponent K+:H+ antiporter subunit E